MSDMNYEEAWKRLKSILEMLKQQSAYIADDSPESSAERDRANGGKIMAKTALRCMDEIEEEMAITGQDDECLQEAESEIEGC